MKKLTGPRLMVGIPNICADILYVTGFKASDPVVFLQNGREKYLVVSRMEIGRARAANPALKIFTPETLGLSLNQRWQVSHWAASLLKKTGVGKVEVAGTFPLGVARELEKRGLRLMIAQEALCPERTVKTAVEIGHMRRVQRAAVKALRGACTLLEHTRMDTRGFLREGRSVLTSERVRQVINRILLDENCSGGEPIVACGPLSANPHWIGLGPLKAGEPIVLDIFPQDLETGYWGDLTRTVVKGCPSPALVRMYQAVKKAQVEALASVRAGARGVSIHQGVIDRFMALGFETRMTKGVPEGFIHGTGHGVGLEIHEAPSVGLGGAILRAGQVVTVEPGLYYTGVGGIRIEDTVVVTRDGFEFLATCPKQLTIR
jgi:Xaa-Pro aminopeptidase